ncbi:MAG: sugar transferase [Thermodesulfobacteriota bacterium]
MIQQQVRILNNFRMVADAVAIIAAGYGAVFATAFRLEPGWTMDTAAFVGSVMLVMFLNNYVMGRLHLYSDERMLRSLGMVWAVLQALAVDFIVLTAGVFMVEPIGYPREFLFFFFLFSLVLVLGERLLAQVYIHFLARSAFHARKILVVGNLARGQLVSDLLARQLSWGHTVIGRLSAGAGGNGTGSDSLGSIEDLPRIIVEHPVDEVVFAVDGDRKVDLGRYLGILRRTGIPARILPALWQPGEWLLSVEHCQDVPFLTLRGDNFNATGLLYKRLLDIAGGLVGCLLLLVMFPLVALAIELDSPGPVLFRQKRVGQNGRIFHLYKFRSMYQDAEARKQELMARNEMQGAMFKLTDDPRITRVGRWLRKTSLDEFPQFVNVLKGEMSLVGTRPPTVEEVERYQFWQRRRISAKPGLTGLWQVSGRNKITDFNQVVELDCQYLDQWRFSKDLEILAKTVLVVLQRKGAV